MLVFLIKAEFLPLLIYLFLPLILVLCLREEHNFAIIKVKLNARNEIEIRGVGVLEDCLKKKHEPPNCVLDDLLFCDKNYPRVLE